MTIISRLLQLDMLVPQTQGAYALAVANRPRHLMAAAVSMGACWVAGATPQMLIAFAVMVGLLEALTSYGRTLLAHGHRPQTRKAVLLFSLICLLSSSTYMAPGVILASHGSAALLCAGLISGCGIMAYIMVSYSQAPLYSVQQLLAGSAVLVLQLSEIHGRAYHSGSELEWAIATTMLVMFTTQTIEVTIRANRTTVALNAAQADATKRLKDLEHAAAHDPLTGLLNRHAFVTQLQARCRAEADQSVAIFMVDIDAFKPINDAYGQEVGDAVLRATGRRLRSQFAGNSLIARIGADEFLVAWFRPLDPGGALALGARTQETVARPICCFGKDLQVTASVGIAKNPHSAETTAKTLMDQADRAMFRAKSENRSSPVLFSRAGFDERPTARDREQLLHAIAHDQFKPYYQPKVDLRTGQIFGFEALARWPQPSGAPRAPGQFLPMVSYFGLHTAFLHTILRQVIADISRWLSQGIDPGQISINLPEDALAAPEACATLLSTLARSPDVTGHITLEITEDVFIARAGGQIRRSIAQLRKAGLLVSLDDFGTGFASFQHLRTLEFDELKIDTSFTADLGTDPSAAVLIDSLINLAQGLNVQIIAEGVEHQDQADLLLSMGCHHAQGYLWDPALPAAEAEARLRDQAYLRPAAASNVG